MKKALIIFNPASGKKKLRDIKKIIQNIADKNDFKLEWHETKSKKEDFSKYDFTSYDRIIAAGGDGTIREIANYIIKNKIKTPLAIIPRGSANILANSLGIPLFPIGKTVKFALTKKHKTIDAIKIMDGEYAFVSIGKGYDSVFIKNTSRKMKRKIGFLAYIISFVKTFIFYKNNIYKAVIDGKRYIFSAKSIIIFNGFTPGIPLPDREISPNDGLLDIIIANPRSLFDILRIWIHYLLKKSIKKAPKLQILTGKKISITPKNKNKHAQIDGEIVKMKNIQAEIAPKCLNIIF